MPQRPRHHLAPVPAPPRQHHVTLAGSLALAMAPKCPACLLAYAGIAGSAGFASAYGAWLAPLTAGSLVLTVAALAVGAKGRGYGPALLALAAGGLLLAGKFHLDHPAPVWAGVAGLVGAALWRSRPPRPPSGRGCARCAPSPAPPTVHPFTD